MGVSQWWWHWYNFHDDSNTDEEIPKEVLATHVSSQDMESIIRLCKEGRMQDALMFYD